MDAAEQWEPDDARVSRPVLRERGGETPPRHSPLSENRRPHGLSVARRRRRRRGSRCAGPAKRNKHAALKLMRKLLKKYGFAPDRLVTDELRSYRAAKSAISASTAGMSAGDGRTIGPRIRINRLDDASARCSGSNRRAQPRSFSPPTPPSTTLSTSNAISRQLDLIACYAPRR